MSLSQLWILSLLPCSLILFNPSAPPEVSIFMLPDHTKFWLSFTLAPLCSPKPGCCCSEGAHLLAHYRGRPLLMSSSGKHSLLSGRGKQQTPELSFLAARWKDHIVTRGKTKELGCAVFILVWRYLAYSAFVHCSEPMLVGWGMSFLPVLHCFAMISTKSWSCRIYTQSFIWTGCPVRTVRDLVPGVIK